LTPSFPENSALTQQLLSLLRELVIAYTPDRQIAFANTAAHDLLGYRKGDLEGLKIDSVLPEIPNIPDASSNFSMTVMSRKSSSLTLQFDQHTIINEETTWQILIALPMKQSSPKEESHTANPLNTKSSIKPEERGSQFSDFTESAIDWFWETNESLEFVYFSNRVYEITGYTESELIGKSRTNIIQKEWLDNNLEYWGAHQETIKQHQPFNNFEYILDTKSGADMHVQLSGKPIYDSDGHFLGYRGAARDITTLKHASLKLEESEKQLRSILESSPIGVGISYLENSIFEFVNARTEELFCAEPGALIGTRSDRFWADIKQREMYLDTFNKLGRVPAHEIRIKNLKGEEFWSLLTWESVNIKGKAAILFWVYDIDDLKRTQAGLEQSRQRFKSIAEFSSDWFWETDAEQRFTYISDNFQTAVGIDPATLIGKTRKEVIGEYHGEIARTPERWKQHLDDLKQQRAFRKFVYRVVDDQGQIRHIKLSGTPYYSTNGNFIGFRGAGTNVTAEEELRSSEERFRTMLSTTQEGFLALDRNNRITEVNPALQSMLGYSGKQLLGLPISRLAKGDAKQVITNHFSLLRSQQGLAFETHLEGDGGSIFPVLIHSTALLKEGEPAGSFAFISDLSEQKRTAEELQKHKHQLEGLVNERTKELEESNQLLLQEIDERKQITAQLESSELRLSQIVDFLPEAMFVIDSAKVIIAWNRSIEEMTGVSAKEMIGKSNYEYAIPFYGKRRPVLIDLLDSWNDEIAETYKQVNRDGDTLSSETSMPPELPGGVAYWNSARPIYNTDGHIVGAIETIRDISALKRAEADVIKAQKYVENILNSMPSVLIGVDENGIVTQWNSEAENTTNIPSEVALGSKLAVTSPQLWNGIDNLTHIITNGQPTTERMRSTDLMGNEQHSEVTIFPLVEEGTINGAVIRIDNITDKVRIEEMMVQSEKMLSVGGLAAGMAHEINNPLAGLLQSMQVLKNRLDIAHRKNREMAESCGTTMEIVQQYMQKRGLLSMIDSVSQSGKRAAQIVQNMLSFSRKDDHALEMVDLGSLISKTIELAANDYDLKQQYDFRHIQINLEIEPNLEPVLCHPSKIQQVILNLLRNGAQEMALQKTNQSRFILRLMKKKEMVQLEVEDNGPGMAEEIRKRVFEPFFTTKDVGSGTGLGLSVSYFIITENHHGNMTVESTPGEGTRFIVQLPAPSINNG